MSERCDLYDKVKCVKCQSEVERIDLFPGGVCITCYSKTEAANQPFHPSMFTKAINLGKRGAK